MKAAHDPYKVLRVRRDADRSTIRAAYRALAWQWHPDRGGASAKMIEINEAWRVLGHSDRRAAFDAGVVTAPAPPRSKAADRAATRDSQAQPAAPADPNVLDFGRYAGWTIARVAEQDPDFLEWLIRMPAGRRYTARARAALALREERMTAFAAPRPRPRRGFFGRSAGR
jgi:curved DNA-binding protein CbpA